MPVFEYKNLFFSLMSDFSLSVGHIFSSCSLLFVWMEVWRLGLVHFGVGFGYKLKICLTAGGVEIVILIFARSDWACVNTWSRSIFPLSRFIIWRISLKLIIITCFVIPWLRMTSLTLFDPLMISYHSQYHTRRCKHFWLKETIPIEKYYVTSIWY